MKYKDILTLNDSLSKINLKGAKFSYGISKNLGILKPEVEAFAKASELSDEYKEYDQKRVEVCKKHSEKDKNGEAILENNEFKITNRKEFNTEIEALNKDNEKVLSGRDEQIKELTDLLEKDIEVTLHKIDLKDIPEEVTTYELRSIIDVIQD